ncbi:PspA/IM30 family protein [Calothrix sp. UHCC 0171]|uniref:PspA/IM30 family protein n=1 Tax=Calothrix sp. UHCC 0171 TaxID=3110245 RepID=UPI002B220FA7|nr:PspA/IM30 family protein [Calothrix sp. UHCC 0171]MEA5573730.1 PspA/IM30 family protein [Calothrix sp. UHCC 0171]
MSFFDRISRVVRANVNSWVSNTEDPEKVLEQTVMEMQDNLIQLRQAVASAIATQKRSERQAANAQSTAEEWYRRAQLALQQGNEPLAREALSKRKSYQDTATSLNHQIGQQNTVVATLKKDMRSLELKIAEVKNKKDMYIARARSAQASLRLQELMGELSGTTSTGVFERVEDKIVQLESQNEVLSITSTDNLDNQFIALASSENIDDELSAMKSQLANNRGQDLPKLPNTPKDTE